MASRRLCAAAAVVAKRFGATAGARKTDSETRRRALAPTLWDSALAKCAPPGLLASAPPWTYRRVSKALVAFDGQSKLDPAWGVEKPRTGRLLPQKIQKHPLCTSTAEKKEEENEEADDWDMDVAEARKVLKHVNAVTLKKRIRSDPRDSFSYRELLDLIKESAVSANDEEAIRYARSLDEAGVVLIFRQNVYNRPERVAKLVASALPFAVVPPDDPRRTELMRLEELKAEIDILAHRQVRRYLWTGLVFLTGQGALFFRLTFWELSWDVMEPVAFFVTSAGLIAGYSYFLVTSRDPSYRDFMQRLFLNKQMKLFKKHNFDYLRYRLLRRQCQCVDPDD